jgi:hypothetical protein
VYACARVARQDPALAHSPEHMYVLVVRA